MLKPKLFTTLKDYTGKLFFNDLSSGVIVGIVALPLAIAFAIVSGVTPDKGLFTAIIAGFIISFLGGSRVQIGGPTGAFVVIVYSIIQKFGYSGLLIATIIAGFILIIMGFLKLGGLIKYIPYSIITGFTSGIAVIIFTSQIGDFFGLKIASMPGDFFEKIKVYIETFNSFNPLAFAISLLSLLIIVLWPKINRKIPGSLIAIVVATLLVYILKIPVETIGTRFGSIPTSIPKPSFPDISFSTIVGLLPSAITIAMLAAIESLLSAVVADGMIGGHHRSNMELIAQGVANVITPLFGGIPATGAIARTTTNIKNGGRTPIAGLIHALILLLIMMFFGNLAVYIPMSTLAAILVFVSWNMSEIHAFRTILKGQRSDAFVLIITFLITVFVDLTVAIEVGMVLAAFLFIKKMVDITDIKALKDDVEDEFESKDPNSLALRKIPKEIITFEIDGPFFFGSVQKLEDAIKLSSLSFKFMILRMRNAKYMDADGLKALEQLYQECKHLNAELLISDIHMNPYMLVKKTKLDKKIGENKFFGNFDDAIAYAAKKMHVEYANEKTMFEPTVERERGK